MTQNVQPRDQAERDDLGTESKASSVRIGRVRAETFGAVVQLVDPPALVAVDRNVAAGLGVHSDTWTGVEPSPRLSAPLEVHVSVTDRCPAECTGCYVGAAPTGAHAPVEQVTASLRAHAERGVFNVAFGGGEVLTHPELPQIVDAALEAGLTPSVTTSGLGLTDEKLETLKRFAQVNVSHDGIGADYERVRGWDGQRAAERAIRALVGAGVAVGINTVVTRENFEGIEALAQHVRRLGARELQLLRFKPSGRATLDYMARKPTAEQWKGFPTLLRTLVEQHSPNLRVRVDCSMVPFVVADGSVSPDDLLKFGVQGCEAGHALETVTTAGNPKPCSFWWDSKPDAIDRARNYAVSAPEPCASCEYRTACRGGCRIVAWSTHGTPWLPDPDCPRVIESRTTPSS